MCSLLSNLLVSQQTIPSHQCLRDEIYSSLHWLNHSILTSWKEEDQPIGSSADFIYPSKHDPIFIANKKGGLTTQQYFFPEGSYYISHKESMTAGAVFRTKHAR